MKTYFLILQIFISSTCIAQVQTIYVKPIQTDPNYLSTEDSSAVSRNGSTQRNKLFLFIGGTGSSSSKDYNALRIYSANLGFDFINLSYPNEVAAASLANNSDSLAFNKYRQEGCFGTTLSDAVTVDTFNAIYHRTVKLLKYLDATYASQNWGQYLDASDSLDWSKIIVGGHSQGSGHAAYFAKKYAVDRVLMFSGANDYSDYYSRSANWIRKPGVTSVNRYFSYLSLKDEAVAYTKQFVVMTGLGMLQNDDSTYVDNKSAPFGNSHCLYTTQPPRLVLIDHNVPIMYTAKNSTVWNYMLTSAIPITTGVMSGKNSTYIQIYPNPSSDVVILSLDTPLEDKTYSIYNSTGQKMKTSKCIPMGDNYQIDISDLKTGVYFLEVNGGMTKIIKE